MFWSCCLLYAQKTLQNTSFLNRIQTRPLCLLEEVFSLSARSALLQYIYSYTHSDASRACRERTHSPSGTGQRRNSSSSNRNKAFKTLPRAENLSNLEPNWEKIPPNRWTCTVTFVSRWMANTAADERGGLWMRSMFASWAWMSLICRHFLQASMSASRRQVPEHERRWQNAAWCTASDEILVYELLL